MLGEEGDSAAWYRDDRVLRDQVLLSLRKVIDPDIHRDIVACGFVKDLNINFDDKKVSFTLELTTPACPVKDHFVAECKHYLMEDLEWIQEVDITLSARRAAPSADTQESVRWLKDVRFILAVSSCKGGVGKSTIAVNLAHMLKERGASVGLADADVYGPSLNTLVPLGKQKMMFRADYAGGQDAISKGAGALVPVMWDGIKLMSYSYFRSDGDAYAAVRGPIASSLAFQMVAQTDWGALDYLILDLPPGTGDIHLTLAQSIKITAAIVISTPHKIAQIDVQKGVKFFQEVNVPVIAIVENMSYFRCDSCGKDLQQKRLKAAGEVVSIEALANKLGIERTVRLPYELDFGVPVFEDENGEGNIYPYVKAVHDGDLRKQLESLADVAVRELSAVAFGTCDNDLSTTADGYAQLISTHHGREEVHLVSLRALRLGCECAVCVDEITGKPKLNPREVPLDVHAKEIMQRNNYSAEMEWSDGHRSIIPFARIRQLATADNERSNPNCAADKVVDW